MKPSQRETGLINGEVSLFVFLSPPVTSSPVQPFAISSTHTSNRPFCDSQSPMSLNSGHLTPHCSHTHACSLLSSNKDSSSSTSPTVGGRWGDSRRHTLGLVIYSMLPGLASVAQQRGGTGKGHTGRLPNIVTSGREQVLMSSLPVATDQLEHGEKSCAVHFSTDVFP